MNQTGRAGEVSLRGVTKRFGTTAAVDNLDLDVTPGEFLALLGPSGCGKTTTLRLIAGFEQADSGEIRIAGNRVEAVPPHKRPVNTVFQQYALFPHMSVLDNVAYGLRQRGIGKVERRRRADKALDLVHMSAKRDQRPTELSGGQQQRVALALVLEPEVLLLDEPLAALDRKLRTAMQLELKRIQREVSITFIVVTHDQQEAMALADRIAVMDEGRIEQLGSPQEVYDRPATPFVAGFVGDMNRLPARLIRTTGRPMADVAGVHMPVGRILPGADGSNGALVSIGVRPDDVWLDAARLDDDRGLPGTVASILSIGHFQQLLVRLDDGSELLAHRPRAEVGEITDGMAVTVNWPPEAALVLEAVPNIDKGDQ